MTLKAWFSDVRVMVGRYLLHYRRRPELIMMNVMTPVMFVLLFAYVFGGAIDTPTGDYIQYFLPGIFVWTVLSAGSQTSVALAEDLKSGMIDRFRSLPMSRSAVLIGRSSTDLLSNLIAVVVMVVIGYLMGFRFQGGFLEGLGALALVMAFGYAFTWVSLLVGLLSPSVQTAQAAGMLWVVPLGFLSSIFVPTDTMPRGLRIFAENQPVTVVSEAVRDLALYGAGDVWPALLWIIGILMVFIPLAVHKYGVME